MKVNLDWKGIYRSILILPFVLTSGLSFAEELYRYQILSYPKSLIGFGCMETAEFIAKSFSEYTGKNVYQIHCDQEDSMGYDLSLYYLSDGALDLVSTENERNGGMNDLGVYLTRKECEQHLPQEIQWFEQNTELPHLIAYCSQNLGSSQNSFFPRIDAFGASKRYPARYEGFISGRVSDETGSLIQELYKKARLAGISPISIHFASGGSSKVVIRYYDVPENFLHQLYYFSTAETARFFSYSQKEALENCRFEMTQAKRIYGDAFNEHAVWFCGWSPSAFQASLQVFQVTPFTRFTLPAELAPDKYKTFSECQADRENVIHFYQKTLKKNVIGAICTWPKSWESSFGESDYYRLRVFIKTPGGSL